MYAVDLKNVLKRFSNGSDMTVLFNNMNLHVSEGELVVITGGKQSGKSTLLRMIAAMTPPNKGSVTVFGENLLSIKQRTEWRLQNIGFITNEGCLIPYLTAKQNLLLGISPNDPKYVEVESRAVEILRHLGLSDEKMNESFEGLSSKEQIITTIGRIFMTNPKLILADDPTNELSDNDGQEVLNQLMRYAKKHCSTIIIASNDPCIMESADRVFELENCQLQEKDTAV
ncbi:ABC transporter ATP-binding protein [Evansella cellulosilytica]|uniref:ABC transporter related protein n=1 Tax=Evansella cellulosilytica (strain ATCC 21833 / DSM 2522 / FERM P-1141 / JCM 9156 / N-4) TaxID=649639 RepID=E6TUQ1_EVAC2|nr:ATP-binding cassette domain-containing protein [Evansella cellulosilytica]ADU30941.1 ABC transporter related protein [Evansella cellulosilytica DSM 2522]